jgi:hypothetical protein|tara:strand:- start:524 stop:691 length:168 start_codon:yes stop_codon:yes gene_type:complete
MAARYTFIKIREKIVEFVYVHMQDEKRTLIIKLKLQHTRKSVGAEKTLLNTWSHA